MNILLMLIPNLWEFLFLLIWMIVCIPLKDFVQLFFLRMETFNVFPFVCPSCTIFWTNLIPNILMAYIFNPMFVVWGLITAFIDWYIIIYTYKQFH